MIKEDQTLYQGQWEWRKDQLDLLPCISGAGLPIGLCVSFCDLGKLTGKLMWT